MPLDRREQLPKRSRGPVLRVWDGGRLSQRSLPTPPDRTSGPPRTGPSSREPAPDHQARLPRRNRRRPPHFGGCAATAHVSCPSRTPIRRPITPSPQPTRAVGNDEYKCSTDLDRRDDQCDMQIAAHAAAGHRRRRSGRRGTRGTDGGRRQRPAVFHGRRSRTKRASPQRSVTAVALKEAARSVKAVIDVARIHRRPAAGAP